MWIKKIFNKGSSLDQLQNTLQQHQSHSHNDMSSQFQVEQQLQNQSPLIDNTPDDRYHKYQSLPQTAAIKFPKTSLHETQLVFMAQSDIFMGSFMGQQSWQNINILVTDRQVIITPNILHPFGKQIQNFHSLYYGYIQKCEIVPSKNKKDKVKLKLSLKDERQLFIRSVLGDKVLRLSELIHKFGFVSGINKFYAFRYSLLNRKNQEEFKGWNIYNIRHQFRRQGLYAVNQPNNFLPLKYVNNQNGVLSPTYPEQLVVPSAISEEDLKKCSLFRTKQRFPALTFLVEYKTGKYSALFRCSQNKVGVINARSKEDQAMFVYIGESTRIASDQTKGNLINCKIYDARGYYAALGNRFAGKGYEKPEYYKNCQIQWLNIPNIHAVRESFNKMMSLKNNDDYYTIVADSGWYDFLYLVIAGSKAIAVDLLSGNNVVVHCSDGWDRTAQLCALAQMLIDPYYRTIEGIAVLVEKDWRNFGHKFRERTGQFHPTNYRPHEKSQIFIQFLDCIKQIASQFPLSFEFNDRFLLFLAKNVDTNIYGTFMTNNFQEQKSVKLKQNTISIWSHVRANIQIYKNPHYRNDLSEVWLNPPTQAKYIIVWNQLFIGDDPTGGIQHHVMRQNISINETLKSQFFANQKILKKLQEQLKNYDL